MATVKTGYGRFDKDVFEFLYTLFVKCSTFRVWPPGHRGLPSEEGSLQMELFSSKRIEADRLFDTFRSYRELVNSFGLKFNNDLEEGTEKGDLKVLKYCQLRQCYPSDYRYDELTMQVDLYCSIEENAALDEAAYLRHQLHEFFLQNELVGTSRLFLYDWTRQEDFTDGYKMAPEGFQRVMMNFWCVVATLKD